MKKIYILGILLFLILSGYQCQNLALSPSSNYPPSPSPSPAVDDWVMISSKIKRKDYKIPLNESIYKLVVYKFSSKDVDVRLHTNDIPLRLEEWRQQLQANIIINGGYFDENFKPTGLLVNNGEKIGQLLYDLDRSGSLVISDKPYLLDTEKSPLPDLNKQISILQSFPLIIKQGGTPGIKEDSNKLARRTVLAQSNLEDFYIIIVDQTPISLFILMEILQNLDMEIDIALNLDGGPSTALYSHFGSYQETLTPLATLPQVISFTERP